MNLHFSQVLKPGHIDLRLSSSSSEEAIGELIGLLAADDRVISIDKLRQAIVTHAAPAIEENGTCICIAHGRTDAVRSLVMAAGRLESPIVLPEMQSPLRLVFVAGIPAAFRNDYLRMVGAIARICSDPLRTKELLDAPSTGAFVQTLENNLNLL